MISRRRNVLSAALFMSAMPALAAPRQAADPKAIETAFDRSISSADQLAWLKDFSSAPNQVGSPHDRANAETTLRLFKQWGWDAHIEQYDVLYPTPISTTLELIAPTPRRLGGQEPAVAEDPSTHDLSAALPPYLAYQGDGDVTAPVVYVNYGMPDDYDQLARRGISVKGKIVIARYGGGWRGLKPKLAYDHGAVGCLIYSDPADDGYARYDPYPRGGGRPEAGVQRGSVEDLRFTGDPSTPGYASKPGVKHLDRTQTEGVLKIPALPISYHDATLILSGLQGPPALGRARGALPISYHWGGTDAVRVHLAVKSDWSLKPIYDVIARIPGRSRPDEWIVRGNHRDGWVFGASDPLTGHTAMLSEAKAIGALMKTGWQPERTIIYASWDAEEPGLLGSTEWVEDHAAELQRHAVLYINSDTNARGWLSAEGNHDLQHLINAAARDVTDPQTGVSVYERARAHILATTYMGSGRIEPAGDDDSSVESPEVSAARSGGDLPIGALGSGSDYTAMQQHLGIPAISLGFTGEGSAGGSYHSAYDTYYHVTHFDDPGLVYGSALSKVVGRLVLRAADGNSTFRYGDFASTVARYVREVERLAASQRAGDRTLQELVREGAFKGASNAFDPTIAPQDKGVTPLIDMLALEEASDRLQKSARAADAAMERLPALRPEQRARFEAELRGIDQTLIDRRGLPGRTWFQNMVYASGELTGYAPKTLPGVREGIEERRFDNAREYARRIAAVLNAYSDRLDRAAAIAKG